MDDATGGSYLADTSVAPIAGEKFNAGPYMTLAGGLTSAWSQYSAGRESRKMARFNAEQQRIQAAQTLAAAKFQENQRDGATRVAEGSVRASQAAGGTVVGAGTNRAVIDSIEGASAMDKMLMEINARRQAYGYRVAAAGTQYEGELAALQGEAGAVSTLLDTGGRMELQNDRKYKRNIA